MCHECDTQYYEIYIWNDGRISIQCAACGADVNVIPHKKEFSLRDIPTLQEACKSIT